jgi:demethylsterigmatocystin 6-O-methyltransferase
LIREDPSGSYRATGVTSLLADSESEAEVKFYLRTILPAFQILPELLQREGWRSTVNPKRTAFNAAHRIEAPYFQWRPPDPELRAASQAYTKGLSKRRRLWDDVFPLDALGMATADIANDRALFVDVGAADGYECVALRKVIGYDAGRIIFQNHPATFSDIDEDELEGHNIELVPHNFFDEQPVQGAKAYYLGNILHCWPDEFCKRILSQLVEALEVDSFILINEIVMPGHGIVAPNQGPTWQQTTRDFELMATHAGMERSKNQWLELLTSVGLRMDQILTYDHVTGDSLIVVKTIGLCTVS